MCSWSDISHARFHMRLHDSRSIGWVTSTAEIVRAIWRGDDVIALRLDGTGWEWRFGGYDKLLFILVSRISVGKRPDGRGWPHDHRSFDFMLSHYPTFTTDCNYIWFIIPYHLKINKTIMVLDNSTGFGVHSGEIWSSLYSFGLKYRAKHSGDVHFLIWDSIFELISITRIWRQNKEVSTRSERTRRCSQKF